MLILKRLKIEVAEGRVISNCVILELVIKGLVLESFGIMGMNLIANE